MQVNYPTKKITSSLCLSTHLSLDETRDAPTIIWSSDSYKEGEKYTLIMYDPNSVTTSGTYIHWVLINISGNSNYLKFKKTTYSKSNFLESTHKIYALDFALEENSHSAYKMHD